jgi:hypothetical protein
MIVNAFQKSYRNRKANILCNFYNGLFDVDLAKTGHHFYGAKESVFTEWRVEEEDIPDNIHFLSGEFKHKLTDMYFDFVICNDRSKFYPKQKTLSEQLNIPLLLIDHNGEHLSTDKESADILKQRVYDYNIGTHKHTDYWGVKEVVEPFIPTIEPQERNIDVLISGVFHEKEQPIIQEIIKNFPNHKILPAIMSKKEREKTFASSKVFINLATSQEFSNDVLLSWGAGCSVVSNNIKPVNDHKEHCSLCKTVPEIIEETQRILTGDIKPSLPPTLNTEENFVKQWNEIINRIKDK